MVELFSTFTGRQLATSLKKNKELQTGISSDTFKILLFCRTTMNDFFWNVCKIHMVTNFQKQLSKSVMQSRCPENFHKILRKTHMMEVFFK